MVIAENLLQERSKSLLNFESIIAKAYFYFDDQQAIDTLHTYTNLHPVIKYLYGRRILEQKRSLSEEENKLAIEMLNQAANEHCYRAKRFLQHLQQLHKRVSEETNSSGIAYKKQKTNNSKFN